MSAPGTHEAPPFRLLLMCTANQCRSPMAEQFAVQHLQERHVDAEVLSCGVLEGGVPASRGSVKALARRGIDLSAHRSRRVNAETLQQADLILTMERRHLRSVAELQFDALDRAFTLRELAHLAAVIGPRPVTLPPSQWIARASSMRLPGTVLTVSTDDDISDPMGGSRRDYRRAADEIDEAVERVLSALFPSA